MTLSHQQVAATIDAVMPLQHVRVRLSTPEARARALSSPARGLAADGYAAVADQSSVALFVTDAHGLIVDANPATRALLGRTKDELIGLTVADITHPEDVDVSRARLSAALENTVASYRISKRYVRGDGEVVTADVTVSLLRDDDGAPAGFLAAAVDDTDRLRAQEEARASAALLRATVDSFVDPWVYLVAVRAEDGRIVDLEYADANRAACEHNETTREALIGRRLLDVLPDHAEGPLARYASVVETGMPLSEDDVPFVTRGELRYFSNRAVAVGADGLSLTWRDTTEQVLLRRELVVRATTDPLTGLLNRDGLTEAATAAYRTDRRSAEGAAVLYLDLDGLGALNRAHGHQVGDAVLMAVADRVAAAVRAGDAVARVGGDEFVVLARGADEDGARRLALKLAESVTRPVVAAGVRVVPTISVGITVGEHGSDLIDLIDRADAAMLERKRRLYAGTDRYQPDPPSSGA